MSVTPRGKTKRGLKVASPKTKNFQARYNEDNQLVSVDEYRKLLNDKTTTEDRIHERIGYLVMFARKIARGELEKYVQNKK